jgi:alkyl sulfatase BDS1-like metallo-beta-lactamase superfamily hydrolase
MFEAAEAVEEPGFESEADAFNTRGYYGTLSHNSKAVYQYYFGWWGGVPADYNALPHVVTAARYVEAMGGADATLALGAKAFDAGDFRWAAEVFNHVVFADPENETARYWLAATYEQLGFQAESGAWRSYYLVGANELRNGIPSLGNPQLGNAEFLRAVDSMDLMDSLAARFNPAKMTGDPFNVNLVFPDRDEKVTLQIGKSVMVPRKGTSEPAAVTLTVDRSVFDLVLLGETTLAEKLDSGAAKFAGNPVALNAFFGTLDRPDFWFPVVTP